MKTLNIIGVCVFLSTFFISCEQELIIEQEDVIANSTTSLTAVIIGNRNKIKQRPRRNYKSIVVVDDPTQTVTSLEVQLLPNGDIQPSPSNYAMELISENENGVKRFRFNQANFENGDPTGKPFKQIATMHDANGEQVGDVSETWVTAQDNDGVDINFFEARQIGTNSVALNTTIQTDDINKVGEVFAKVDLYGEILISGEPLYIDMTVFDPTEGNIGLTGTATATVGNLLPAGIDIKDGDEITVTLTIKDINGDVVDEDQFVLVIGEDNRYIFNNFSHKKRPNGGIRIKGTVRPKTTGGAPTSAGGPANNLTITVPNPDENNTVLVVLEPIENTDGTVFIANPQELERLPTGFTYTSTVRAYDEDGVLLTSKEIDFVVEEIPEIEGIVTRPATIKLKNNGASFKGRAVVKGTDRNQVERIRLIFEEPFEGPAPLVTEVIYQLSGTTATGNVYRNNEIDFDNPSSAIGNEYPVTLYYLDSNGNTILQEQQVIVVEDLNTATSDIAIDFKELSQNNDGESFSLTTEISGVHVPQVAQVAVFISPQDGGSDADPDDFILNLMSENGNFKTFSNDFVTFSDPDSVIDMEYLVEYTFSDFDGNELGYHEEIIVGQEGRTPRAIVCMANGATNSEFSLTIETNDPDAQSLDIVTVQFLNEGELFSVHESYDMIRSATNANSAVFSVLGVEFLDLNQVTNGIMKLESLSADLLYASELSFNDAPLKKIGLGYYNEETGKWECEDDCLEPTGGGELCGTTGHL